MDNHCAPELERGGNYQLVAPDSTPGDGFYNYWQGGACNNGVKYIYQAWY